MNDVDRLREIVAAKKATSEAVLSAELTRLEGSIEANKIKLTETINHLNRLTAQVNSIVVLLNKLLTDMGGANPEILH